MAAPTRYLRGSRTKVARRGYRYHQGQFSRRYKKQNFSPRRIGDPIGSSEAKQHITQQVGALARDTRILYWRDLTQVQKGDDRENRERNIINLSGWRMHMYAINLTQQPLTMHWAIVSNKQDHTAVPNNVDFFRSSGTSRAADFGTDLTGLQYHSLHINTDKYVVLKHKKFLLTPSKIWAQSENYVANSGNNYRYIKWWIKCRRQLRFERNADTIPYTGRVYLVHWAATLDSDVTQAPQENAYKVGIRTIMYWREPKSG